MSCCNSKTTDEKTLKLLCPDCNEKGAKIKTTSLQNHLLQKFKALINKDLPYQFCKNPSCEVVYFSKVSVFYKDQLKEKVTIKSDDLDVKTCYCFNITKGDIVNEIKNTGDSSVIEVIKKKMKDPGCFCETSNPQGGCCLANNMAFIKATKNEFN